LASLESTRNSKITFHILLLFIILGALITARSVFTGEKFHLSPTVLQKVQTKFGSEAMARLIAWEDLLKRDNSTTDMEKLQKVNSFFNKNIAFASDMDVYGVEDYWATPIESLSRGAGDCEDYAIAKYFSLKIMGVAEEKIRISYVKSLQYNMFHMVMLYYKTPDAEPLVLDNLVNAIKPASERKDLLPIFTFNGAGLWLAHERGQGKVAGKPSRLAAWNDLLRRMTEDGI
jgi:predicted transglutaminase-like cysteine proteinase